MTKKENYAILINLVNDSDIENKTDMIDFLNHEIELLSRKSSKSSETKTQKENKAIMESISTALREIGKPVTITELQNGNEEMAKFSNQKISALLRQMANVVKITDKKKSYFSIVDTEEES